MCMALYLATDEPVSGHAWSQARPSFNIQPLTEGEQLVRSQFSKPNVVYLGAHTGCSCGFSYGHDPLETPEDREEDETARRVVALLRTFLEERLEHAGSVELFACWEGGEQAEPEERLDVTPSHFGGESFRLPERRFYVVRRAG